MEDLDDCIHDDIVEGVCENCGLIVGEGYDFSTEFSKNYTKMNTTKVSILDTLEGIPKEVIDRAKMNIEIKQEENGKKIRNDAKILLSYYTMSISSWVWTLNLTNSRRS
jgi:hypothetical protein